MQEIYGQFVGEGSYRPSEMGRRYVGSDPTDYPVAIMTTNHGQGDEFFYADSQDAYDRWRNGQRAYPEARQSETRQTAVQPEEVPSRDVPKMGRIIDITDGQRGAMGGASLSDRIRPVGPQQSGYSPFSNLPEAGRGTPSQYYPEDSIPRSAPRYVSPFEMPQEYQPQSRLRREAPVAVNYRPERLVPSDGRRPYEDEFPYTLTPMDDTPFGPVLPRRYFSDSYREEPPKSPIRWYAPDLYRQASSSGWGFTPRPPRREWEIG